MPVTNYHTINGRMIGETTDGVRTDYLTDALGNITATLDQSQNVLNTYRYKPYGGLLAKTGTAADPRFLWTGDTGSRTTGLSYAEQYNRARHYGSRLAGWTSVDPLWPQQPAYSYATGTPTVNIDPSGLAWENLTTTNLRCIAKKNNIPIDNRTIGSAFEACFGASMARALYPLRKGGWYSSPWRQRRYSVRRVVPDFEQLSRYFHDNRVADHWDNVFYEVKAVSSRSVTIAYNSGQAGGMLDYLSGYSSFARKMQSDHLITIGFTLLHFATTTDTVISSQIVEVGLNPSQLFDAHTSKQLVRSQVRVAQYKAECNLCAGPGEDDIRWRIGLQMFSCRLAPATIFESTDPIEGGLNPGPHCSRCCEERR